MRSADVTSSSAPAVTGGLNVRTGVQLALSVVIMTLTAVTLLTVALITLFRARRFYSEVIARAAGLLILRLWRLRLVVHRDLPWPTTQTVYISNHTSTIDVFVLIALGLPNARFFLSGYLRKVVPLGIVGYLIGIFWTPWQTVRANRVRCFARADRILRRTGESVFLSPEGERVTTGEIGPFNKGAFHLATSLKAPIVPLYIFIPREIDPGRGLIPRPGTVHVYVEPPIETSTWLLEDLVDNKERVRDYYVQLHRELRRAPTAA
jgi:1-acyl-sn-glycerol-3-phosphate acyltransferase